MKPLKPLHKNLSVVESFPISNSVSSQPGKKHIMSQSSIKNHVSKFLTGINNGCKISKKTSTTNTNKLRNRKNKINKKWNESGNLQNRTGKGPVKWNSNTIKLQPMCSVFWTTVSSRKSIPTSWHHKISINSIESTKSRKKLIHLKRKKTYQSKNSSRKKPNLPNHSGPKPNNKFSCKKKSKLTNCWISSHRIMSKIMLRISRWKIFWPISKIKYNRCKKSKTGRRKKWRESRKSSNNESWNSNRRMKMMTTIRWPISAQSPMQNQLQVKRHNRRSNNFGWNRSSNKNGTSTQQARSQASQTSTKRSLKT